LLLTKIFTKIKPHKVDFLIAGVQKGGTTILDYYLRKHPDICMANNKEVHFFDNENLFKENTKPDYDLYHSYFKCFNSKKIRGEATPIYSYWKPSAERIFNYNKNIKIILLLRNPIERAYSHWNKECINFHSLASTQNEAVETLPFYEAIINEESRCSTSLPLQHRYYSYIDRGFYSVQLKRLMGFFPLEQILVLKSEWLQDKPESTLHKVYSFLDINNQSLPEITHIDRVNSSPQKLSPVASPENNPVNIGKYKKPMSSQEKNFLKHQYIDEIKELEKILNWNCSDWLD